jgi:hypothetical protein
MLLAGSELTYKMGDLRYGYLAPALGVVTVNNERLEVGDGIAAFNKPTRSARDVWTVVRFQ